MRALIQRVSNASVSTDDKIVGTIDQGLLVFLGIQQGDGPEQADKLLQKLFNYRVFADKQQKMNLSVQDVRGGVLVISQFTLAADTNKGLRPGFSSAASPDLAEELYDYFLQKARHLATENKNVVASGRFGANMKVNLTNDGPVTFLLEIKPQ